MIKITTKFETEEEAVQIACSFAGVLVENAKKIGKATIDQFGFSFPCNLYEVINRSGKKGKFAIGEFRDGYDLWLIEDNGFAQRV